MDLAKLSEHLRSSGCKDAKNDKDKMRYDKYRKKNLPLGGGTIEGISFSGLLL